MDLSMNNLDLQHYASRVVNEKTNNYNQTKTSTRTVCTN